MNRNDLNKLRRMAGIPQDFSAEKLDESAVGVQYAATGSTTSNPDNHTLPREHNSKLEKYENEEEHHDDHDHEKHADGNMARRLLQNMADNAQRLLDAIGDDDDLPAWWNSKLTKAADYLDTAADYLHSDMADDAEEMDHDHEEHHDEEEEMHEMDTSHHFKKGDHVMCKGKKCIVKVPDGKADFVGVVPASDPDAEVDMVRASELKMVKESYENKEKLKSLMTQLGDLQDKKRMGNFTKKHDAEIRELQKKIRALKESGDIVVENKYQVKCKVTGKRYTFTTDKNYNVGDHVTMDGKRREVVKVLSEAMHYHTDDNYPHSHVQHPEQPINVTAPYETVFDAPEFEEEEEDYQMANDTTPVKVPAKILTDLAAVVGECKAEAEKAERRDDHERKHYYADTADALQIVHDYLGEKTVEGMKRAQLLSHRMANVSRHLMPDNVWKFIVDGGEKRSLKDYMHDVKDMKFPIEGPRNTLDDNQ